MWLSRRAMAPRSPLQVGRASATRTASQLATHAPTRAVPRVSSPHVLVTKRTNTTITNIMESKSMVHIKAGAYCGIAAVACSSGSYSYSLRQGAAP